MSSELETTPYGTGPLLPIDSSENNGTTPDTEIEILGSLLIKNKNYFLSWHGQRSMQILTEPSTHEIILQQLFAEITQPPIHPDEFEIYEPNIMTILEQVTAFFIQAFIHIVNEDLRTALKVIYTGKWFSEYCISHQKYLDAEYLPGIKYLCRCLKIHVMVGMKNVSVKHRLAIGNEEEYEKLPNKSKAVILATKCYFLGSLRTIDPTARAESLECLRLVIKYDSEYFTLHYKLGNWLWWRRGQDHGRNQSVPSEEEIFSLWKAYDCCVDLKKNKLTSSDGLINITLAGVCQCLADIVRNNVVGQMKDDVIKFGSLSFQNSSKAAQFILETVTSINTSKDSTFPVLIRAGEIVFNILPKEYRDYDLAEELLTRAFMRNPTDSKINHRLGVLFLLKKDFERSLKFLRSAVEHSPENVPASMELMKTLMNSPEDNSKEVEDLVKAALSLPTLNPNQRPQLQRIHGCLKFMLGNRNDAIQIWMDSQKSETFSISISVFITSSTFRYKWPKDRLDLDYVKTSLESYLSVQDDLLDPEERTILCRMIESITLGGRNNVNPTHGFNRPQKQPIKTESDLDTNWRKSSGTNRSAPETSFQQPVSHNQRSRFTTYAPRYDSHRQNKGRSPSPDSWR